MIYIYSLSHPITNEVRYIGKTININRRYKQHLYDKRKSHKASWVQSLRNEGLKPNITILEVCFDNWQEREIFWIAQFDNLTNLKEGGGVDYKRTTTEETKEKISKAHKGKNLSDETKQKISQKHKGKQLSEETKQKISESTKNKVKDKMPEEIKEKISNKLKGRKFSEETREKLRQAKLGRKLSEEIKTKISLTKKKK